MLKKIVIFGVVIMAAIIGYNHLYQDHRDIENENATFVLTSKEIANQFSKSSAIAEQKYLNKTIEVSGLITDVNPNDITIDDKVFCQFQEVLKTPIKVDAKATIKGRVIGYDDLLEQVKLDQCTIIN